MKKPSALLRKAAARAGRDVLIRSVARAIASALQAGVLILVARAAGPSEFGLFAICLSIAYLTSAATGVGASTRILRVAAETEWKRLADALFALRLIGSAITIAASLIFVAFGVPIWIALAAGTLAASDQLLDYVQAYFAGRGRQLASSLVVILQRLLPFAGVMAIVLVDRFSFGWVTLFAIIVAGLLAGQVFVTSSRPRNLISVARASSGYWFAGIVSNLTQLEPAALKLVADSAVVGLYAIAARVTNPLTILISALQTVLVPELAKRLGTHQFQVVHKWFVAISVLYALTLSACSTVIADIAIVLLGDAYSPARTLIVAMVIASGLSAIAQAFQAKLIAEGRPYLSGRVVGIGVTLGLVFMMTSVATLGPDWLWLSPLVSHGVVTVGMIVAASRNHLIGGEQVDAVVKQVR